MSTNVKITKPITGRRTTFYRWIALSLLTGIGLVALYAADHALRLEQQTQQKYRIERVTRLVLSRLNTEIQIPLDTVASMHAFMLASPDLPDFSSFDRFAAQMLRHTSTVDGFAFVGRQGIIRHFYPLAGNEKAIGLDLMARPAARYVEAAIRQKSMVLNPPAVTVQGRLSTIARIPLYHGDQLLGLVQGVIDINKTLELVMEDMDSDVHVALVDASGRHFWGPSQFPAQARELSIKVGSSHWLARVWLTPNDMAGANTIIWLVWLVGSALLLSLLFIVNRTYTESARLTTAIQNKTAQLTSSEARWRSLLEQVHLIGVGLDRDGRVSYVNPFFCKVTGFEQDEVVGKEWFSKFLPTEAFQNLRSVYAKLQKGDVINQYLNPILTKSGQERVISWFNARLVDEKGEFDGTLSIGEDITARRELEKRLDYLAYHDTLTGLPNRTLLIDRLGHAVKRAQRDNTLLALLIIDLDQFKNINDSLGHFAGDLLLQAAAQRFQHAIRSADTVARLGGDEFTILLENVKHIEAVEEVADKILQEFSMPFEIEKNKLYISASVGIVIYPMADDQIEDLLRAADTAMYHAKAAGRNCYRFYEASMGDMAHNQLSIANNLHDALIKQELSLVFQPIVNLANQHTVGYETLSRWHDSVLGAISPADFIPVAESTGLIVNIGYWVLREACRSYSALRSAAATDISLAVNVSAYQFQDKNFIATFRNILAEEGMPPQHLIVEMTESQLMDETQMALQVLNELRSMGCQIAIDDFGTGYSSLSYLRVFPVDSLKIDRSFIADLTTDDNSIALLKAILMIADSLHINVVAEGVETPEQLTILKSLGVRTAQGFYLGRPSTLTVMLAGVAEN